ncbi:prepilin peptidase [Aliidiomarina taiwanensis]|uniref:Prepilin leader peptidase/N-methyltransferase n=1 Tax=Aliidiomarina taiwanensis TaxID=946228 RepID=A0A432X7Q7_9GAMM|nr:A24 family peptidase [Aliidiomarina taiwanensis]RUO42899.1 prepilin peptidase [Aliidiomarina taiwanensis]
MLELIQSYPALGLSLAAFIGLLFGSFANVVIARLPVMMQRQWQQECAEANSSEVSEQARFDIAFPGSHCPHCQTPLRWYENIPLLSFLLQGGACRHCQQPISWRYPAVEAGAAFLTALCIYFFEFSLLGWSYAVFVYLLLILTCIDKQHMLLPDQLTLPLVWLGLLASVWVTPVTPTDAIIGAAAGYLCLWLVFWLFKLLTGKEGMGYGDFKLLAALGAWLGWQMLPMIILLSSVIGAAFGLIMIGFQRHQQGNPMPFGPFLAFAGMVALFFGESLYHAYWQWLGL